MTVAELIRTLAALPRDASVALGTILPDQHVRWDDIERVELRAPDQLPAVVLIRLRQQRGATTPARRKCGGTRSA
jgi:hypothetical protein